MQFFRSSKGPKEVMSPVLIEFYFISSQKIKYNNNNTVLIKRNNSQIRLSQVLFVGQEGCEETQVFMSSSYLLPQFI